MTPSTWCKIDPNSHTVHVKCEISRHFGCDALRWKVGLTGGDRSERRRSTTKSDAIQLLLPGALRPCNAQPTRKLSSPAPSRVARESAAATSVATERLESCAQDVSAGLETLCRPLPSPATVAGALALTRNAQRMQKLSSPAASLRTRARRTSTARRRCPFRERRQQGGETSAIKSKQARR